MPIDDPNDPRSPNFPKPGEQLTPLQQAASLNLLKRNLAISLVVVCPILIALPPRKLDVYTFCLGGTTFISLNHLQKHMTGRSFLNRVGINDSSNEELKGAKTKGAEDGGVSLPTEKARRYRQMMKEKKEAEAAGRRWEPPKSLEDWKPNAETDAEKQKGVLESLWLGNAKEDWKAQRERKEREAFERGDGVGTLIQDYFQEAMGYKKDEDEEAEEETKK
jgi:hypothetical protein